MIVRFLPFFLYVAPLSEHERDSNVIDAYMQNNKFNFLLVITSILIFYGMPFAMYYCEWHDTGFIAKSSFAPFRKRAEANYRNGNDKYGEWRIILKCRFRQFFRNLSSCTWLHLISAVLCVTYWFQKQKKNPVKRNHIGATVCDSVTLHSSYYKTIYAS